MAKRSKRRKEDRDLTPEPVAHKPKENHPHLATEYLQTRGREAAEDLTRKLLPHHRDAVLGNPVGLSRHPAWTPSVKDSKFA